MRVSRAFDHYPDPINWAELVKKHVKKDATEDECNSWRNRMKVPLQQVMLAIFDGLDLSKVANLSAMLWWSHLGVSISMSSSFGERIASGGSWALKRKSNILVQALSKCQCLHVCT